MKLFVESAAIRAPGLTGWSGSRAILAGEKPYEPAPLAPLNADLLPAVERRRTGSTVKMALSVGQEALASAARPVDRTATVFVSSGNDGDVINDICITHCRRSITSRNFVLPDSSAHKIDIPWFAAKSLS